MIIGDHSAHAGRPDSAGKVSLLEGEKALLIIGRDAEDLIAEE